MKKHERGYMEGLGTALIVVGVALVLTGGFLFAVVLPWVWSWLRPLLLWLLGASTLVGCGATVQPVRYQPVPVVVTKPCLAGKPLPREATIRTDPVCEKSRVECVADAVADIEDLKREAVASRKLLKECSK